ncbi:UTRA domain-containing protein [Sphingomonas sp. GB1N7]|uniref:UTRA domain-containing protein n=1 Tax=Parasphingomonas caseinilytica TaxID=3096158 RepID=UPI002FCA5D72
MTIILMIRLREEHTEQGDSMTMLAIADEAAAICSTPQSETVVVPPLDGEGPLWLQIRRSLAASILNGDWPAGTRVPAEMLLTVHYATSRMTVNKAIQSLATEGLVERRPKTGTVVTGRARERPVMEIWDAADAVRRGGGHYGYRLLECGMIPADSPFRDQLPVEAKASMIRMLCLHLSDDRPFQLEERLINVEAAPKITCQPLEDVSPGQWLLAHVPWTEAKHSIAARGANPVVAGHLDIEAGTACLVVERRTWNGDVPVTLGRFWYPGDEHSLEGQFRPSW